MEKFERRLQTAFDPVKADESLKKSIGTYVQQESLRQNRTTSGGKLRPTTAMLCILLVFFGGYFTRVYFEPVSVISIDINPSIELGINAFDHVISVEAFNEDGRQLTEQIQLRFLNYEEAVDRIITSEKVTALLEQEEELVLAVVGEDEQRNESVCEKLETYTDSGEKHHCYSVSPDMVVNAHGCGMSYGKYLAYQNAQQQGVDVPVEEVQDMTMKEIREITEEVGHTECDSTNVEPHHGNHGKKHGNGHH